jgi:hypothetical protein
MLLNGVPPWRHRGRPEPLGPPKDLNGQISGNGGLCQLKGDVATLLDDLGTDLNELVAQCDRGPVLSFLLYGSTSPSGHTLPFADSLWDFRSSG